MALAEVHMKLALSCVTTLLAATLSTACAASAAADGDDEPAATASAGATSTAAALAAFEGEWIAADPREPGVRVAVAVDASAKGPDGERWGATVTLTRAAEPRLRWRDRAPFFSIGGGQTCSSMWVGGATSAEICHEATHAAGVLAHTVTIREKKLLVPVGSSRATQTLRLTGSGAVYRYEIDGAVEEEIALARAQ